MANPDNSPLTIREVLDFEGHTGHATIHIDPLTPAQLEERRIRRQEEFDNLAKATAQRDEEKYGVFLGAQPEPRGVVFEASKQATPAETGILQPQPAV